MPPASDNADDSPPVMPRWVKIFIGIIVVVLVALLALKMIGGAGHGPGLHKSSADTRHTKQGHR